MQIKKYVHANNQNIIIFQAEYYQIKKYSSNGIQYEFLFEAQDREKNCIGPGLLFYYKEMSACLLIN